MSKHVPYPRYHPVEHPTGSLAVIVKAFPQVTTIVDATEPLTIVVRPEHISAAVRKDPTRCALAIACKALGYDGAYIVSSRAYVVSGKKAVRYFLSNATYTEIRTFDGAGEFEPSTFTFSPVAPAQRFGRKGGANYGARKKAAKRAR